VLLKKWKKNNSMIGLFLFVTFMMYIHANKCIDFLFFVSVKEWKLKIKEYDESIDLIGDDEWSTDAEYEFDSDDDQEWQEIEQHRLKRFDIAIKSIVVFVVDCIHLYIFKFCL
jgi:hypothetical protein